MDGLVKIVTKKPEAKGEKSVFRTQTTDFSQSLNSPVDQILFLQRTVGNQAVQRLIKSGVLQAKLRIGAPGDVYEQEADRVADAVMRMPKLQKVTQPGVEPFIQREVASAVSGREARATAGEIGMAFAGYRVEEGWAFLTGPGGSAGHRWNEPGFDGVAFRVRGSFEIHILDNKSLARAGSVSSASALTTNLLSNLDDLIRRSSEARFNDVPRINQIRSTLQVARTAVAGGQAIPTNVRLIVTNFGGQSTGITTRLTAQGITFRDLMAPRVSVPPGQAVIPQMRGAAIVAGSLLALAAIGGILNWIGNRVQASRAREALARAEQAINAVRIRSPNQGVLIVFYFFQVIAPRESLVQPGPRFTHIEWYAGATPDEARRRWVGTPSIRAAPGPGERVVTNTSWIPPLQP
jgi:hypothetical protein